MLMLGAVAPAQAQQALLPTLQAGALNGDLRLDGVLDEPAWAGAEMIQDLVTIEPLEGKAPVGRTTVRVLAGAGVVVVGIECFDPDVTGIVSYSKARDADLGSEDHIKLIFDTFLDGRSGYIFAVNATGARYDALVANQGEGEAREWDTAWEAATARTPAGWSVEIRIPLQSLAFSAGLAQWGFNVQRRLQRLLETSRWASPRRDAKISSPARAGRLTGLPDFSLGLGLTVRPTIVSGVEKLTPADTRSGRLEPSLDVTQRLGPNALLSATVNTDFAETEVDARRTNLTRFSLFFPEKRTFFLENSDIFAFGIGLSGGFRTDIVPFFSRRIGLYQGTEVPLDVGGKLSGRAGNTNFGALAVRSREDSGLVPAATMGAFRIKQNVLRESSVGILATVGDPEGRPDSWMVGTDWTYQTSRLWGDKNFLVGVWGLATNRSDLTGDKTAVGWKIDYPNDTWDIALTYKRVGDGFDPSLSFVSRRGVQIWSLGLNYSLRPGGRVIRQLFHELQPFLVLDLDGRWESYRLFSAPINWRFESGERFEFNIVPEGERLVAPFEIADGVLLPPGSYHWVRYRLEGDIAAKRQVSGRVTWWFGPFYDGTLHQLSGSLQFKPSASATFEIQGERNDGEVSTGVFTQDIVRGRVSVYFSPDLQLNSFVQYDNDTRLLGANTRLRWTFHPLGDLFVVYNHNAADLGDRLAFDSNQLLVKLQYAFRM
ncbi:MAG: carbohydrate binding family 9 domain-containing protein [Gemmatimonadetes bacterium]|nr:carbohydrate binding family 9 domain-containing protein [Gemmatimonadota bacterium]